MSDAVEIVDLTPAPAANVDHSLTRKAKDIAAGFIGGATQVLIGQPADLVKIRLQTSHETSSLSIIKQVLKNEGILAFYKGTLPPLFGVGVCVSLQFYGFHEAKRQILNYYDQSNLNLWPQTYIAGAVAGIVNTPVAGPIEQLRILSQSNTSTTKNSLSDTVKRIYQTEGIVNGIYRGFGITLLREIQAYGVWFLTYETLIQQIIDLQHYKSRNDISTPELLASGALAGNALWLSSYPIDVIKSNIQSDKFGSASKFNGRISAATRYIYQTHGLRGFWRGIVPCLLRAVPCSAGTFASVELALRLMG
ncbi:mitochondrial carrier protein [Scheffersomyces stipitis CBS 6054]|uniref:Mitochondrial thiamine pyrophosphate carrier 1 n=1 Tax=Scheffersomyces stipitis (strain ATCC 58785 / CBS 6054 / NBRC 10063 / NRRL Y-11545) TaxID=322104 RepID=A3LRW8_PICST|nr:mitochondrial carrier protein [Scheffersomyces stipitis CBS 6054]ABN65463.1 mitochondrial carrier protein [Scheffersomyces stipitis CBS 6054]